MQIYSSSLKSKYSAYSSFEMTQYWSKAQNNIKSFLSENGLGTKDFFSLKKSFYLYIYIGSTASEVPVKLFSVGIVKQVLVQLRHRHTEDTDTVLIPADRPHSPDLDVLQEEI